MHDLHHEIRFPHSWKIFKLLIWGRGEAVLIFLWFFSFLFSVYYYYTIKGTQEWEFFGFDFDICSFS